MNTNTNKFGVKKGEYEKSRIKIKRANINTDIFWWEKNANTNTDTNIWTGICKCSSHTAIMS